ncbi:MAG: FtsQ-type POTRA domain-containing protein [Ignavibacteriales bacterium]|nr:FtsQ-type POTRA domain-containing protein [Ignavibacteriales bacterium]
MDDEQKNTPKKKKQAKSSIYIWVMIPIMLGFITLAVYGLQWKSDLKVQRVIVDGARHLQAKEVVALSSIQSQSFIDQIDAGEVEQKLLEHPLIKSAKVESQLPDAIRITIVEREPFAVVNGNPILYVDSEAVLLPQLPSVQFDLPIINGITGIDAVELGHQVPNPSVFMAIEVLKQAQTVGWYHAISEIKIGTNGEIMLFSIDSGVPIFIGKDDIAGKLQRLQTFWKNYVKNGTAAQLKYLDLRFDGQVVVKWDKPNERTTRIPL